MKITIYKKAGCPWAGAVIAFLNELDVGYEAKMSRPTPFMPGRSRKKSGKCISPTVELNGEIVADASVEDVASLLEERGIVI